MLADADIHRATGDTLSHWLRLLWDVGPPLHFDSDVPHIAGGAIHLPRCINWRHDAAAAAHAAAHLVYSPPGFDPTGLAPISRALVALLEDARVEALAMRELPGLARLWRPWHTATPALGGGFEALMARLSRSLIDPRYDDPDPWVRKGRVLFYLDPGLGLLALRTPAEVRRAATLLGNDIGQMRLQFNAKTYRPEPAYRDDHRWMWPADVLAEALPPPQSAPSSGLGESRPLGDRTDVPGVLYPEWDSLISRVRPDWTRVVELPPVDDEGLEAGVLDLAKWTAPAALHSALATALREPDAPRLVDDGEMLHLPAVVDWRTQRAAGHASEGRIYKMLARRIPRGAVLLLVDQSASTALRVAACGPTILTLASEAAAVIAGAFESLGLPCAIAGFSSRGRHAVEMRMVKGFQPASPALVRSRLASLRPGGSTRLGAVLRHGTAWLARQVRSRSTWLLVLTDGEPHDIDIHDPRYLTEDARHAVREASRHGVAVRCLAIGPEVAHESLRRVFRNRAAQLTDPSRLAQVLGPLMAVKMR